MDARHPLHHSRGLLTTVVLTLSLTMLAASPALAATRTWIGGGANNLWSTAGNWAGGLVPASGDLVVISDSATTGLGTNDFVNLSLAGLGIERSCSLFGNAITIGANGIKVTAPASGGVQIAVPLQLSSDQARRSPSTRQFGDRVITIPPDPVEPKPLPCCYRETSDRSRKDGQDRCQPTASVSPSSRTSATSVRDSGS